MSDNNNNNNQIQKEEGKIKVRFVTNDPNIRVTEIPFGVPERLGRLGLSEIVNHLRSDDDISQHKPFDFLINGQFIRTTLDKHIKKAGIKEEDVITIEYVEAITEPKREQENQHDDWIAAVDGKSVIGGLALTGGYDFGARIVDHNANTLLTAIGHQAAIKTVAWVKSSKRNQLSFLTGSLDQTIRYWNADATDAKTVTPMCVFKAHQGSIEAVASNPEGTRFASGGYDNKLRLWDLENLPQPTQQQQPAKKRKNSNTSNISVLEPAVVTEALSTLETHTQPITTIVWPTQFQLLSGGMDKSIRLWDLETMSNTQIMMSSTALHAISYSIDSGLIASGHADHTIRLWDPRVRDGKFNTGSLLSHKNWVTSVSWKQGSNTQLLSGSHDGTVKLWDIRSKIPLFTLEKHTDKVLSCDWLKNPEDNNNPFIISGGADTKLKIYSN